MWLNEGQKYCRMLPLERSATLLTFIKPHFVIKIFVLSIFDWPFYTGFIVYYCNLETKLFLRKGNLSTTLVPFNDNRMMPPFNSVEVYKRVKRQTF